MVNYFKFVLTDEKKLQCDQCGIQVKSNSSLKRHMNNIHLNISKYCCSFCNKKFYSKQNFEGNLEASISSLIFCKKIFF